MNIVARVKNILLTPKTEWDVIAAEPAPPKDLVLGYVLPLAALAAICGFISSYVIGHTVFGTTFRMPLLWALVMMVYHLVMAVISVIVMAFIIDTLAPSFGGTKNFNQAFKVAVYTYTAAWVGAVFGIIPWIGWLISLIFLFYCIYILYLGLPRLMKNPEDKTVLYTVVVIIVAIVVFIIIGFIATLITAGGMAGAGAFSGMGAPSSSSTVTYDKDSPMGKLDAFSKKMDEASKRMEAAQKSGDQSKQAAAAMGVLGAALSGGKAVEPVQLDVLKPFVPEQFAGLPRSDLRTERSGVAGMMVAKAEGVYSDGGGKRVNLEVVDTGGMAGLMGMATWLGVQGEREDSNRRESTRREGSRTIHEEVNKHGGSNKFTVVLNDRFVVSAAGSADIDTLKSGVASLELGKLESIK
jgi:hypothetical protein